MSVLGFAVCVSCLKWPPVWRKLKQVKMRMCCWLHACVQLSHELLDCTVFGQCMGMEGNL